MSYLSQAAGRIKRALRQEARLQAAHVAECREREHLGFTEGFYPESLQRLSDQFADEVYFHNPGRQTGGSGSSSPVVCSGPFPTVPGTVP